MSFWASPAEGSSRRMTPGSTARTQASSTMRRVPVERSAIGGVGVAAEAEEVDELVGALVGGGLGVEGGGEGEGVGDGAVAGEVPVEGDDDGVAHAERRVEARLLEGAAEAGDDAAVRCGRR